MINLLSLAKRPGKDNIPRQEKFWQYQSYSSQHHRKQLFSTSPTTNKVRRGNLNFYPHLTITRTSTPSPQSMEAKFESGPPSPLSSKKAPFLFSVGQQRPNEETELPLPLGGEKAFLLLCKLKKVHQGSSLP